MAVHLTLSSHISITKASKKLTFGVGSLYCQYLDNSKNSVETQAMTMTLGLKHQHFSNMSERQCICLVRCEVVKNNFFARLS